MSASKVFKSDSYMSILLKILVLASVLLTIGCASAPQMTNEQIFALESSRLAAFREANVETALFRLDCPVNGCVIQSLTVNNPSSKDNMQLPPSIAQIEAQSKRAMLGDVLNFTTSILGSVAPVIGMYKLGSKGFSALSNAVETFGSTKFGDTFTYNESFNTGDFSGAGSGSVSNQISDSFWDYRNDPRLAVTDSFDTTVFRDSLNTGDYSGENSGSVRTQVTDSFLDTTIPTTITDSFWDSTTTTTPTSNLTVQDSFWRYVEQNTTNPHVAVPPFMTGE